MPNEQEVKQAADELDAHAAEIIKWHFRQKPVVFWLDWAKEQSWNPIEEVSNFNDFVRSFPTSRMSGFVICLMTMGAQSLFRSAIQYFRNWWHHGYAQAEDWVG